MWHRAFTGWLISCAIHPKMASHSGSPRSKDCFALGLSQMNPGPANFYLENGRWGCCRLKYFFIFNLGLSSGFPQGWSKISQAFRVVPYHITYYYGSTQYTRISTTKVCPLAYLTTNLARISRPIAIQMISKIIRLDSFLKTSVEGMFPTMYVDVRWNKISFLQVFSRGPFSRSQRNFLRCLCRMAVPMRKGSLGKDIPSVETLVGLLLASTQRAASALVELSSSTSSSWCGLCQWPGWAPHRLSACVLAPWACSWSLQSHEPNSAASGTSGSSKRFFCHQWLGCSNTLACPWWSLEGSLAAAQNRPISYQKVLVNSAACRHSCLENNRPSACCCSCQASEKIGFEFIMP